MKAFDLDNWVKSVKMAEDVCLEICYHVIS